MARPRKPDSGHADTISLTVRVHRADWNAMKPRIQCVLTHWKPGFMASGSGPNAVKARIHGVCGGWVIRRGQRRRDAVWYPVSLHA